MADLKKHVKKRKGHRLFVTETLKRTATLLTTDSTERNVDLALQLKASLVDQLNRLEGLDEKILDLLTEAVADKEDGDREIFSEVHESGSMRSEMTAALVGIEKYLEVNTAQAVVVENSQSTTRSKVQAKLPKLEMPTFTGRPEQWQEFWDTFQSAVHDNGDISDVDKFAYLRRYVSGAAKSSITGFRTTAANYGLAIEALQKRFGKKSIIHQAHVDALLNLQPVYNDWDTARLRKLYDAVECNHRALEALDVNPLTYESIVTQNRFNVLATEEENVIPTDSFGMNFNISQPFAVSQTFTKSKNSKNEHSAKNQKNLVPGERSYAQVSQREAQHAEGLGASKAPLQQRDSRSRDSQTNRRDNQANRKPTVSIVGDSMLRRLRKQDVNREASHIKTFIKTFPGATIEHMQSYLEPTISMSPDGVIILCGTNNLKKEPPDITANKLIDLAISTKRKVRQVAVSSIILRGDSKELEMKRRQVNRLVEIGLSGTGIEFITHDNIDETHLDEWGLHLNFRGGNVLANNLINFLNET